MALVLVIGSMFLLAAFAMTALAYTMQSEQFARYSQDHSGAMTAAQSGVEDYLSRLNRNDQYGRTVDCTNAALRGPMAATTNTCGWTLATPAGWLPVAPGETDPSAAWFHVAVDNSRAANGELGLTVTGRVNGEYRSVDGTVGKGGSTDYVYYTDFESADPSNVQAYSPSGATVPECGAGGYASARYFYNGRSEYNEDHDPDCKEITFIAADTLDGAVFSNDAILSDGAKFSAGVETANPACATATSSSSTWKNCLRSGSTANFNGVKPELKSPKYLDDTSAAFATNPGCHYVGSTRVIFHANATMTVWNKSVNNGGQAPIAIGAPTLAAPDCGTVAALNSTAGATIVVPDELVIFAGPAPTSVKRQQCDSGDIGGTTGRTLPLGDYEWDSIPATLKESSPSYIYDTNMTETTKFCAEGNLYVEGILNGRVTVAAAQSVVVTGDLVLAGTINGDDMLGLVATNSVEIFHPRLAEYEVRKRNVACGDSGAKSLRYCPDDDTYGVSGWPTRYADPTYARNEPTWGIQIAGSIQTLQHSFLVQKYNEGSARGQLQVNGSIAQRWRGIVGTSGYWTTTGYTKLYQYDTRLTFAPPPYFPRWANSQWTLRYSGEINTPPAART